MQEQLIKMVAEKVGIPEDKAGLAVSTIMGFLKDNPKALQGLMGDDDDSFLDRIKGFVGGDDDDGKEDGLGSKLGKMFGRR